MNEVYELLAKYGLTVDETVEEVLNGLGVNSVETLAKMKEEELEKELGMKRLQARTLLEELNPTNNNGTTVPAQMGPVGVANPMASSYGETSALPAPIPVSDLLKSLKVDGKIKVGANTYLTLMHAQMAEQRAISTVPERLLERLNKGYEERIEVAGEEFWEVMNMINARAYDEILGAVTGGATQSITLPMRQQLLVRLNTIALPAVIKMIGKCNAFLDEALQLANATAGLGFSSGVLDLRSRAMLAAITQIPDTGVIRFAADELRDAFNKTCVGPGVAVAARMAAEYAKIKEFTYKENIWTKCGFASRDQMVREMGIDQPGEVTQTEEALLRFVHAAVELDSVPMDEDGVYVMQMCVLAKRIDVGVLTGRRSNGAWHDTTPAPDVIEVDPNVVEGQPAIGVPPQAVDVPFRAVAGNPLKARLSS